MRTFFILSMGRSGTQMLATLLNRVPGAVVKHEPDAMDVKLVGLRHADCFDTAIDGLLERRFRKAFQTDSSCEIYGEVNSYLRYEAAWLRARLDARVLFVCRDGRDFVRSAFRRPVYTERDAQLMIVPRDGDPAATKWSGFSRFEKLCWYWAHTNTMLLDQVGTPIRMEQALSDYSYFEGKILTPLEMKLKRSVWNSEIRRPRNTSRKNARREILSGLARFRRPIARQSIPHWSAWNEDQTERFWAIAGPVMKLLGYAESEGEGEGGPRGNF